MQFDASRFFHIAQWFLRSSGEDRAYGANALFQIDNPFSGCSGITLAALRYVKTKLHWVFAFVFGLLASLALPSGAAEGIVSAMAWVGDLRIAELAVAANALTIVP